MTARLVAVGQKQAAFPTLGGQYAIGEPMWEPLGFDPSEPYVDEDLIRKQRIEDEIAWGTDI